MRHDSDVARDPVTCNHARRSNAAPAARAEIAGLYHEVTKDTKVHQAPLVPPPIVIGVWWGGFVILCALRVFVLNPSLLFFPHQTHGYITNRFETRGGDLVYRVIRRVPRGIVEVHDVDRADAGLLQLEMIVDERVFGSGDEVA